MGKNLTLEEKVGQLMMFGFKQREVPEYIKEFILQHNLGGIIHFSRNIVDPEQIKGVNAELQDLARQSPSGTDLLISVDQEGGSVARLTTGVSVSPGNMGLGATKNPQLVEEVAAIMGEELRAVGFNVNLAPCVDVNNNPLNPVIGVRSYGSEPSLVGELGKAAIKGFQRHLLATAKHFPGHGDTNVDSHLSMPIITHDWERLSAVELPPFEQAIAAGVEVILAAHVLFPALESNPRLPATLSHNVLTKLLREKLGFTGLIFTDCMEMEAITKQYSMGEAAVLAIEAGVDMVLISHTPERQSEAYWAVIDAVKSGRISMERIEESYARVKKAKETLAKMENEPRTIGSQAHFEVMRQTVRESLTVVQDRGNLPLQQQEFVVIETRAQATSIAEEKINDAQGLADYLRGAGFRVQGEKIGLTCSADERKKLVELTTNQPLVIIVSQDAHRYEGQSELIQEIIEVAQEVIVIGARTPYELNSFPQVPTYVAAYSNRSVVWEPLVELLTGKIQAQGKLPVSLG
jgi:beta-N-acetylhexosaminidase